MLHLSNEKDLIVASQNNDSLKVFERRHQYPGQNIALRPEEVKAEISYPNEKRQLWEFYRGSTFQSQSSRSVKLPSKALEIHFYDNSGRETRSIGNTEVEVSKW